METDPKLGTFILMWNPEISSVKMDYWKHMIKHFPFIDLNWSVWEYDKSGWTDSFYMMKVGKGKTGIVMKGYFSGMPQMGEDWSGKGRPTFYRDLDVHYIIDPEKQPMLTTDILQKEIPDFDWTGGHSGRALTQEQSHRLIDLWNEYIGKNPEIEEWNDKRLDYCIEPTVVKRIKGMDKFLKAHDWYDDNDEKLKEGAFHDSVNLGFAQDYENGTFTLRYLIQDGETVVTIVCSHLSRIKMDLESGYSCMDGFRISEADDNLLHLEANGVEVWCENIEIKKVEEYDSDGYPVGI